jgi:hypothetical protein
MKVTLASLSLRTQDNFFDYMAVRQHEALFDHSLDIDNFHPALLQRGRPFALDRDRENDPFQVLDPPILLHFLLACAFPFLGMNF